MDTSSRNTAILLTLIALGVGYMGYTGAGISLIGMSGVKTQMVQVDSVRDSITVLQSKIDVAKRDIARESVEDVTKRVNAYRASLALLRTLVPAQREVDNLLDDVSARMHVRGVRMTGFAPLPPVPGPAPFDTYAYQFTVVGHYDQVASFLTDIASLRRIMVPTDVRMVAASEQLGRAYGDTTSMLEAHFTVRTYVKAAPTTGDSTHAK